MAKENRAALLAKTHKVLRQHYKPYTPAARPVLEQLLFAACAENAQFEPAEKAYESLRNEFIDWNEVRVSTVTELAESMRQLPEPAAAATNLKKILQSVFETTYSFDLEPMKKQKLGSSIERLGKMAGASPFIVEFVVQNALGGHAIPLGRGSLEVLRVLGLASEEEVRNGNVTGLERAIPKNKGIEFSSLLHQIGAEMAANPFSVNLRKLLLSINPDAKERFIKRGHKEEPAPVPVKVDKATAAKEAAAKEAATKAAAGKGKPEMKPTKGAPSKEAAKAPPTKLAPSKEVAKAGKGKPAAKEPIKAAPIAKKKPLQAPVKKPVGKPAAKAKLPTSAAKKTAHKQLAKRKPR